MGVTLEWCGVESGLLDVWCLVMIVFGSSCSDVCRLVIIRFCFSIQLKTAVSIWLWRFLPFVPALVACPVSSWRLYRRHQYLRTGHHLLPLIRRRRRRLQTDRMIGPPGPWHSATNPAPSPKDRRTKRPTRPPGPWAPRKNQNNLSSRPPNR